VIRLAVGLATAMVYIAVRVAVRAWWKRQRWVPKPYPRRTGHRDRGPGGRGRGLGTALVAEPVAGSETV